MDNKRIYVKGDKETVLSRRDQVHTVTLYCPMEDEGVLCLKEVFESMITDYKTNDNLFSNVPCVDAVNAFLFANTFCEMRGTNMDVVNTMIGVLKTFRYLKYINFEFVNDPEIMNVYHEALHEKRKLKKDVYKVEVLEMNLFNMFSQDVVDMFNKVLVMNDIISNSYMNRSFRIDFKFDEFVPFANMFVNNNMFVLKDGVFGEYFTSFPPKVISHKPDIRVITNYRDL